VIYWKLLHYFSSTKDVAVLPDPTLTKIYDDFRQTVAPKSVVPRTKDFIRPWQMGLFNDTIDISGVARVLRAPVQRHAMGPPVTKQLSNYSFAARTAVTRPVDRMTDCGC